MGEEVQIPEYKESDMQHNSPSGNGSGATSLSPYSCNMVLEALSAFGRSGTERRGTCLIHRGSTYQSWTLRWDLSETSTAPSARCSKVLKRMRRQHLRYGWPQVWCHTPSLHESAADVVAVIAQGSHWKPDSPNLSIHWADPFPLCSGKINNTEMYWIKKISFSNIQGGQCFQISAFLLLQNKILFTLYECWSAHEHMRAFMVVVI